MKQYRFTSLDANQNDQGYEDAVLDPNDPVFQIANGVVPKINVMDTPAWSTPTQNKAQLMKENNIKPGTEEWFKLWFGHS